jgi:hypothetical protein
MIVNVDYKWEIGTENVLKYVSRERKSDFVNNPLLFLVIMVDDHFLGEKWYYSWKWFSLLFGQLTMIITVKSEKIYNHSKNLHDITEIYLLLFTYW